MTIILKHNEAESTECRLFLNKDKSHKTLFVLINFGDLKIILIILKIINVYAYKNFTLGEQL